MSMVAPRRLSGRDTAPTTKQLPRWLAKIRGVVGYEGALLFCPPSGECGRANLVFSGNRWGVLIKGCLRCEHGDEAPDTTIARSHLP
jgi:hypothetical protein